MARKAFTQVFGEAVKSFFGGLQFTNTIDFTSSDNLSAENYVSKEKQLSANVGWVFAANQVIADECASLPIHLYRVMEDGDREEVFNHPVLDLLNNPNAILTSKQMWNLYFTYLNLTGESYVMKLDRSGKPLTNQRELPTALYPMPSHLCQFYVGEDDYSQSTVVFNGIAYPIKVILRDINPDPVNFFNGMSIVRKASLTVDTDIEMKKWNNKMFKNNARGGSVISFPNALSDDNYKRAKQMFNEQYSGSANAFKNIILDNGATVSPFMMSQQDLDFLASKAFTRDEILAMFKVSASNLGITEEVNRASATTQEYGFRKRCVKPRLDQFTDFINERLLKPIYGGEYVIGFEDVLPEDVDEKLNEAREGVNKWLTIDEVREQYGLEPLPNGVGDDIYSNIGLVPLQDLKYLNEDTDNAGSDNEPESGGDEDGGTPDDTPDTPKNPPEAPELSEDEKAQKKRQVEGNKKADEYEVARQKYIKQVIRASRQMFNAQKKDIYEWLDENGEALTSKTFVKKKGWADEMVDWASYKTSFGKRLLSILQIILEEVGSEEFARLVANATPQDFDPTLEYIQEYLLGFAQENADSINDETEKQIKATLSEGIKNDETIEELKARVSSTMGTASTARAYTIALTTTSTAQNYADVCAWKQSGVVAYKEWFTAEDSAVCGFCASMDGKRLPLDDLFFEKGDVVSYTDSNGHDHKMKLDYRAIGTPSLHPNCRCVLLPVIEE